MLSIGKLGRGAEGYYLNAVAKGVEDYYLGSGEAMGRWIGIGSRRLGLARVVDAEHLRAVLDGRRPSDGQSLLWVRREDRLPGGFDLTFSRTQGRVAAVRTRRPPDLPAPYLRGRETAARGRRPNWYDPGRFWSGEDLEPASGARLGGEIALEVPTSTVSREL